MRRRDLVAAWPLWRARTAAATPAARRTKTLALMRQAKNLPVAYMPYKVHLHNVALDLVQPWTHGYWRHPFMRDIWRFVDVEPAAGAS